ncbi:MAG: hypothetical protein VB085_04440 [Peptococcaceae bacterium]|nr:hypothetical protein [Peptococcaceae bacterium]
MRIYLIHQWKKKLKVLLAVVVAFLLIVTAVQIWQKAGALETLSEPEVEELEQDVLEQPLRVQALPESTLGEIPS